jgi:hypothetical protein
LICQSFGAGLSPLQGNLLRLLSSLNEKNLLMIFSHKKKQKFPTRQGKPKKMKIIFVRDELKKTKMSFRLSSRPFTNYALFCQRTQQKFGAYERLTSSAQTVKNSNTLDLLIRSHLPNTDRESKKNFRKNRHLFALSQSKAFLSKIRIKMTIFPHE